jgi:predicted RNase H-like HicB family nuclease
MFVFTGIIRQEEKGFSSLCPELDVASFGLTMASTKTALLEAVSLHLEGSIEDGLPYLRPVPPKEDPRRDPTAHIIETFVFKVDVAVHAYA